MNNYLLSINGLTKRFNDRSVLDIEEATFESGKIHVIVGHNGAGKTILLRLVAGLEVPTSGSVRTMLRRGEIGFCAQRPFMFRGTAMRNLQYGRKVRKLPLAGRNGEGTMHRFGLTSFANSEAKKLSAGEMQLISIARTMVCAPSLLLLDEPTANLDPERTRLVENEIVRYANGRGTVIMTTHAMDQAVRISENILRLENGRIVSPEIANFFEGEIVEQSDRGEQVLIMESGL
jgi:tungstate transport system ATP-binding protein